MGAASPHLNCSHGKNCDWVSPQAIEKQAAETQAILRSRFPDNREGRRALERAMKQEWRRSRR